MAKLSKISGALTESEFQNALKNFPRLSAKGRVVAHAILVEGKTIEWVVEHFETSRQLAHLWATNIYKAFKPDGWETEVITLPKDLMDLVRKMELDAREKWQALLAPARIIRER